MFVFGKNKKKKLLVSLFVFSVVGGIFLTSHFFYQETNIAFAQETWDDEYAADVGEDHPNTETSWLDEFSLNPFKWLLYYVFVFFGWLASVAITLFEWAINPKYISGDPGLFNRKSIYDLWKFIRDFFNLFFILVLLYIAFTVVFQIQKDFKKALLSLVLAALFINFSFPVTRFLIDATNVPMYFFANQMAAGDGKGSALGTVLSASRIKGILIPGAEEGGKVKLGLIDIDRLIAAIVFIFIFAITLLVLAVMFVIRLIALLILLVFSSVGFVASIIPGMEQYSKMWWENFWKYAIFGPAAMLMVLVAVRFFSEIGDEQSAVLQGLQQTATGVTLPTEINFIASMAMFSIPIIILWMAMGLAQKFSIAGASSVVGFGQKAAKWIAKKATYDNAISRGVGLGLKERAEKTPYLKVLTPKFWNEGSKKREERIAGGIGGGKVGYNRVVENQHNKKVAEAEKMMEENRTNKEDLEKIRDDRSGKSSKAEIEAAVRLLSKKDHIQDDDGMRKALAAMSYANTNDDKANTPRTAAQAEKRNEIVRKAGGEIYKDGNMLAQAIKELGNDKKAIVALVDKTKGEALNSMAMPVYSALHPDAKKTLEVKMKKEGAIKVLVNEAIVASSSTGPVITKEEAVTKVMHSIADPKNAAKILQDPVLAKHAEAYLDKLRNGGGGIPKNLDRHKAIRANQGGSK